MATAIKKPPCPTDAEWAERLDGFVQRAQEASIALRKLDQEAVDRIVWAMTVAGLENAVELAELAMEETHFGVFEDKVLKNYIATEFLYDYLRDKKSVGVIDEDRERALQYVAEPIGVVLALLPITNLDVDDPVQVDRVRQNPERAHHAPVAARAALREARRGRSSRRRRGGRPASQSAPGDPRPVARGLAVPVHHPGVDFIWTTGGRRRSRLPTPPGSRA